VEARRSPRGIPNFAAGAEMNTGNPEITQTNGQTDLATEQSEGLCTIRIKLHQSNYELYKLGTAQKPQGVARSVIATCIARRYRSLDHVYCRRSYVRATIRLHVNSAALGANDIRHACLRRKRRPVVGETNAILCALTISACKNQVIQEGPPSSA
jgi:hypothetical protein